VLKKNVTPSEEHVPYKEFIGAAEYLMLQIRCCINQCHYYRI